MILFYNYDSFDCYIESLLETETSLCLYVFTFTQLPITSNHDRVQVNTGASENRRLVRARDW